MSHKRRARLPFHDTSTDTYQNNCNLYVNIGARRRRGEGTCVFYYPPKKWQKTGQKGQLLDDPVMERRLMEESYQQEMNSRALSSMSQSVDLYATLDGEIGPESDEEYQGPGRKRNRKGRLSKGIPTSSRKTRKSRAKHVSMDDDYDQMEAQHFCGLCGKSFMHKTALSHHIKNHHDTPIPQGSIIPQDKMYHSQMRPGPPQSQQLPPPPPHGHPHMHPHHQMHQHHPQMSHLPPPPPLQRMNTQLQKCVLCSHPAQQGRPGLDIMLKCTDCAKWHHPHCMEIKPHMIRHIQKYNWQCTDCKSCHACGKSENDEAILFCDQCDRGFHLYCLTPPLKQAPQGSWTCRHCN